MSFSAHQYYLILLFIIIGDFLLTTLIDWLNLRKEDGPLPQDLKDIYDVEKYRLALQYHRANTRFGLLHGLSSVLLLIVAIVFGLFGFLDSWVRLYFESVVTQSLAFFGIVYLFNDIWNTPWQWYANFQIEAKFGFNKMKPSLFWKDKLRTYLLSFVIGGLLLAALIALISYLGDSFWWIFWIVISIFMVGANFFYSTLILPLFNKLTPLEEGSLRDKIFEYAERVDFPLKNVYVMDGSRRSTKANAFFSGFGKLKKIVLFDTLVENYSDEELVAILAHEVGHYKKSHTISMMVSAMIQSGVMLYLLSYMIFDPNLSQALGADQLSFPVNLIAFAIIYSPVSMVLSLFSNYMSRKHEFEADEFATNTYNGDALKNALKKLSVQSLSNLKPHKLFVVFHYSHPPLLRRLEAIERHQ